MEDIKMEETNSETNSEIETKISVKIDNLIQNYCYNFLSYLYKEQGWKRAVFETCKENYIESNIKGKQIRIIITSDAKIMLTCYCLFDVIKSIEFIMSEFKYGRMGYYIVMNEKTVIDTIFTSTYYLTDYIFDKEEISYTKFGKIVFFKNEAILTYTNWEDGEILKDILVTAMQDEEEIYEEEKEEEKEEKQIQEEQIIIQDEQIIIRDDEEQTKTNNNEKIILSVLILWSIVRLNELL
jgi:hypothetical protein